MSSAYDGPADAEEEKAPGNEMACYKHEAGSYEGEEEDRTGQRLVAEIRWRVKEGD